VTNPTCEVVLRWEPNPAFGKGNDINRSRIAEQCGKPAAWCYPAMGGGFMRLCDQCAERHKPYADVIDMIPVCGGAASP
jgi:hypothetical protein